MQKHHNSEQSKTGDIFFVFLAGAIAGEYLLFVNGGFVFGILLAFGLLQLVK